MNKRAVILSAVVAAAVLISGIMISLALMGGQSKAQAAGETAVYQYVLKTYNNQIAVYEKGGETPIRILKVPVNTLPYLEQSALENGVQVKNDEELRKMIEDYTG